jgi:predicted O-methyltransferase YrrM
MRRIIRILGPLQAVRHNKQDRDMTTLTTPPLATLLTQLFEDAEASSALLEQTRTTVSAEELTRLMTSTTDYRAMYERMKDFHLAVSRETGTLLYMLARASKACSIVEFGTSFGISTLHLAAALRDNGGGRLISTEFETSKIARAQANIAVAGLADLVEIRAGDALETLATDLPDHIDLVLLDGAKSLYPKVFALLEPQLRQGALIVADNADWCPEYLSRVRAVGGPYLSVPFANDVELTIKL